ncbi:hypothetical protein EF888_15625 [Silicimonas algicola]|uniref:1,4-alpha-glucan branching enzyme n=1 Tax=Silicimonas algicola TaxID=1826607 RepID=A0A316G105_9RHOB|nr:hypothetical protein [Silicimonas algicola]AZQ68433.1 hypothetical protein EF888_15625 [Silicimonas algicola]PWK53480.1 hypothetical protein C8D95_1135 [Silicimonas algicola]
MTQASSTIDHDTIRTWAEERNGHPARVKDSGEGGILRIDFDPPEDSLEEIEWEEFFSVFEKSNLAFLYQEKTEEGSISRFNKLVHREEDG